MKSSGVCFTAQRTIKNSATIGIFRNTISHKNVHTSTIAIIPAGKGTKRGFYGCADASRTLTRAARTARR
jgi:hypothetical protein